MTCFSADLMTSTTAAVLRIGLSLSQTYFPSRNTVLSELYTVNCGIDPALSTFHLSFNANTDRMCLSKIRRFNRYYTLPILLKGHDRLIGVFRRTDGQYCGCKCFAARTFEPWLLTNDALVLQVARYEDELAHAVYSFLLPRPPNFTPHFHVHVTQGGREIASFPNCARDDTSTDRRSAGNGAQETASEHTSSGAAPSSDRNCSLM